MERPPALASGPTELRRGFSEGLAVRLPPTPPIIVPAMVEAEAWPPIRVTRPIYRGVFDHRSKRHADIDGPPRPCIPVAAVVVPKPRPPERIARPVPSRDIDPSSRLDIRRWVRHRNISGRCCGSRRFRAGRQSRGSRKSSDDQSPQHVPQHWLPSFQARPGSPENIRRIHPPT